MSEVIAGPVTFIVSRQVKPGLEAEYEAWARGISAAALHFEGHLGVNVIRPGDHAHHEYVTIFRFDTYNHLRDWENSAVRWEWLEKVKPLVIGETKEELMTGLEYWFSTPEAPLPPARHRQALLTLLAIYPLSMVMPLLLQPVLNPLPALLRSFIVSVALVLTMTYIVMPRLTRLFSRWLFTPRRT